MATTQATSPIRVVVIGGGFGGVYTALHLEKMLGGSRRVAVTLISRENYFLMTPLLFEAGSGVLEPRHAVSPIRPLFKQVRFVEAQVDAVDFDQRVVTAHHPNSTDSIEIAYDHVVLALGGVTNRSLIPGSGTAMAFKTLADAIDLRNHVIEQFERADATDDPALRQRLLSFVVIGGGLVGVELMGELTEFLGHLRASYPRLANESFRYHLIEAGPKMLSEMDRDLADYATEALRKRGVSVEVSTLVAALHGDSLSLADGRVIEAETIVLAAGVAPNPLLEAFDLPKSRRGQLTVSAAMQCPERPEVWALGDCAAIPDPEGKPYPPLAQHALREARVLATNILAAIDGRPLKPFVYQNMGTLASLGSYKGVGKLMSFKVRGFLAWWIWRTYYVMQMPRLERRVRIVLDWTLALFFKNDVVKLDLYGQRHPRIEIEYAPQNVDAQRPDGR